MNEALQQLIDAVKAMAPQVWAIYLRQVYLKMWLDAAWGLGFLAAFVYSVRFTKNKWSDLKDAWGDPDFTSKFLLVTGCVLLALFVAADASLVASYLYNAPYYAIQLMLGR
jgi:hypothetical protein